MKNPILMELPEVMETSRLRLQMPRAGCGPALHEALMDGYEDGVKWLNWSPISPTSDETEEACRRHHAEFIFRKAIRYIIMEKDTKRIVGRCGFAPPQVIWDIPQFGVAYFIRKSARNQGVATEAAHALTLLAFRTLQAKKVEIYCDAENIPSQKVPEHLGFTLEYSQKGGWPRPDHQLANLLTYSLFSEEALPKWGVSYRKKNGGFNEKLSHENSRNQ